jgi:MoaA/NifB/PqqE/SkfB family radical SAM enzyme
MVGETLRKAGRYLDALAHPDRPSYLILFVTGACNARCSFCFDLETIEKVGNARDLRLDELQKVARGFRGLYHLTVTGGEPFLRADLPAICKAFYEESGVRSLTLTTNGSLSTRVVGTLRTILDECPELEVRLSLSLDDLPERHDAMRKLRGLFAKAVRTLDECYDLSKEYPRLVVSVITVFSRLNEPDIARWLHWAAANLRCHFHSMNFVRGEPGDPSTLEVSPEVYDRVVALQDELRPAEPTARTTFHGRLVSLIAQETRRRVAEVAGGAEIPNLRCTAGRKLVVLYEDGRLSPCEILHTLPRYRAQAAAHDGFSFGNVRDFDYDVPRMLDREGARKIKQLIWDTNCNCTFECAMSSNIAFKPRNFFPLAWKALTTRGAS